MKKTFYLFFIPLISLFILTSNAFCADTTPPQILQLNMSDISYGRYSTVYCTIQWKTDEPVEHWIYYRTGNDPNWAVHWETGVFKTDASENITFGSRSVGQWYMEFRDQTGNLTRSTIYEVPTNPYLRGSVNINSGALTTGSLNVTLNLQAYDPEFAVTQMCFSNDNQTWSSWETYQTTKTWPLPAGEGVKTVYVRFKNSVGSYMLTPAADSISYSTASQPWGPSVVQIKGKQLFVQRRLADGRIMGLLPYKIKGVCWAPTSVGVYPSPGEFTKWYRQDIALMKQMGINTVRTYNHLGSDYQVFQKVLDELLANGMMIILSLENSNYEQIVSNSKNHPAILMWQVDADEWRYLDPSNAQQYEAKAKRIKQLDPYHPVVTILRDSEHFTIPYLGEDWWRAVIETVASKRCPSIDIWGLNVYRSGSFGGLFYEWSQISQKPMFVSEAGTDCYDHRINNENQSMQANFNAGLWDEAYFHLSADRSNEPNLGNTFFEWNDEWGGYTNVFQHDPGGDNLPYSHPDGVNDKEYFGLVDIYRAARQAYFTLGDRYEKQGQLINLSSTITVKAVSQQDSNNGAAFFRNGERFYSKGGGAYGGRGFNFAIIDPKIGLVEQVARFDTWLDSNSLLYVKNYINTIPHGKIVLIAIGDEGGISSNYLYREAVYQALEDMGSRLIRSVGYWDAWAMISIKGQSINLAEGYRPYVSGQSNVVEIQANVPLTLDVDRDGIPDSADSDRDNDGLTDSQEYALGSDPLDSNTDDDNYLDNADLAPAVASIPQAVSVSPASGSSRPDQPQLFTTVYEDADKWQDIQYVQFLINTSTGLSNCFFGHYDPATNKLYLRNDANTVWLGGYAPGSSNIIENSFVQLNCAQTSVNLTSPTTLTVNWHITFKSTFLGLKGTYLCVVDKTGASSGCVQRGTWKIGTSQAPQVVKVKPSSGSCRVGTTVAFTGFCSDPDGRDDISRAEILMNTSTDGSRCFYGAYDANANKLYLRNDANAGWLGGFAPGSGNVIENSYVKVYCSQSAITRPAKNPNLIKVKWAVSFKSPFVGQKKTFLYVKDDANTSAGWTQKGTWTVQR